MAQVRLLQPVRGNENRDTVKRQQMHETRIALLWLARRWPRAFCDNTNKIHPLMIGIREVILDEVKDDPSAPPANLLLRALQVWTRSSPYVNAAAQGRDRINLNGDVESPITPEHQRFAQAVLDGRKRKAKTDPAPKPPTKVMRPATRPVLGLRRATA